MNYQKKISAMYDSLNLIESLIEDNEHNSNINDIVYRNMKYLEFMLENDDDIKNSNIDLNIFKDIIIKSKNFIS